MTNVKTIKTTDTNIFLINTIVLCVAPSVSVSMVTGPGSLDQDSGSAPDSVHPLQTSTELVVSNIDLTLVLTSLTNQYTIIHGVITINSYMLEL